jgi:hypothetical protein
MGHTTSTRLESYWTDLRGERIAPRRFDIEPGRIAALLPHIFILEARTGGDYGYRLAGTALCELFGLELRGASFLAGWSLADTLALERALAAVTAHGSVARVTAVGYARGDRRIDLDGVLLPLVHGPATIDRVLGCLAPTVAPDWLGSEPLAGIALATLHVVASADGTARGAAVAPRRPAMLAAVAGDSGHPTRPVAAGRPQLRVVGGDLARQPAVVVAPPRSGGGRATAPSAGVRTTDMDTQVRKARLVRCAERQFRVYDGGRVG